MKKTGKIACIIAVIFLLAASPAFSQMMDFGLDELQGAVNGFSTAMAKSLPFNSTLGLNWSDSYIGKLIGVPPHFGIGLTAGFTTIKMDALNDLLGYFDFDLPIDLKIGFPFPAYTVDVRLGGFFLPFDLGVKFGYLDTSKVKMFDSLGVGINYMLAGADIRFALIDPKVLPIKVSIGAGFNYLTGGITLPLGRGGFEIDFNDPSPGGTNYTIRMSDPSIGLIWQTKVAELKAQVSFPLFIITPYAGAGLSYSWSQAGYKVESDITINNSPPSQAVIDILNNFFGVTGVSNRGFESIIEDSGWNLRLYGGLSLNIAMIKIDATVMYNLRDSALGATLGLRFQL